MLLKAKVEAVDGLVWTGFQFESNAINKQKTELDIAIPVLCGYGKECISDEARASLSQEEFERDILFDFEITDAFKEKYRQKYGQNVSDSEFVPAAFGYEEVQIFAQALRKCPEPTTSCLYQNLPAVQNYPSALNSQGFDKTRNLVIQTKLFEFRNGSLVKIAQ